MRYYIVISTCPSGGRIHTRHYTMLSVVTEMTWRAINGHTEIYAEDCEYNFVYVL